MNFPLTTTGRCPQMHRLHTAQAPQVCEGWISQQVRRLLVQDRLSCVISWACSRDIAKHAKPTWTNRNWKLAFIYPWGKYSLQFKVCRIVDIFSIYLGIHVKGTFLDERIWSNITRMCFFGSRLCWLSLHESPATDWTCIMLQTFRMFSAPMRYTLW